MCNRVDGHITQEPDNDQEGRTQQVEAVAEDFRVGNSGCTRLYLNLGGRRRQDGHFAASTFFHPRDDVVGLVHASTRNQPARRLRELEAQQNAHQREHRADDIHNAPAIALKGRTRLRKGEADRERRDGRGQDQAQPDAEECAQRRHDEDQRGVTGTPRAWCHLVDIRVYQRQVGSDAQSGNCARDHKIGVVRGKGVVQRANTGQ